MKCPYCGYIDSKVIDSRTMESGIRRRRECLRCGLRFTTYERIQSTALLIIKRDGRREDFNREKLTEGIRKACAKRALPIGTIEKVVDEIETELQRLGKAEVPSSLIGEMVMERLKSLDRVAYIRFASVYREFRDIESFKQEVDALLSSQEKPAPEGQLTFLPEGSAKPGKRKRGRPPRSVNQPYLLNPNNGSNGHTNKTNQQ